MNIIHKLSRFKLSGKLLLHVIFVGFFTWYLFGVLLHGLSHPLMSYDEAWYAAIAQNIIDDKTFMFLSFNGHPYYDHPPVGFWLMSLSMLLFGPNEVAARIPSVLAGGISILLMYVLGKNRGGVWLAFIPPLLLSSSLWFVYRARSGNLDVLLLMFFLLTYYCFERLFKKPTSLPLGVAAAVSLAGLLMTKTLVGLAIIPVILIMVLFSTKKWGAIKALLFTLVGTGATCWPWYFYNAQRFPGFFTYHFFTIGMRSSSNRSITIEGIQKVLLYFRSGVGKWYYPTFLGTMGGIGLLGLRKWKHNYIFIDLVWFGCVGIPFFLSPKTEIWHLIPVYGPAFLLITSVIAEFIKMLRSKTMALTTTAIITLAITLISMLQLRNVVLLLQHNAGASEKDIALKSRNLNVPIYVKGPFLPAYVFYSKQEKVEDFGLRPYAYDEMKACLLDPSCVRAFIIDKSDYRLATQDNLPFTLYDNNDEYTIILTTLTREDL